MTGGCLDRFDCTKSDSCVAIRELSYCPGDVTVLLTRSTALLLEDGTMPFLCFLFCTCAHRLHSG